jgi:hypothetical protein
MRARSLLLFLAAACVGEAPRPEVPSASEQAVPRRPFRDVGCGITESTRLEGNGIGDIRIGASAADLRAKCRVTADSTLRVEGLTERVLGIDAGYDTVTAVIVSNRVWRIHVPGNGFTTSDGIGVGTPASDLRSREGSRLLAGEGVAYATIDAHCGLSFRLAGVTADIVTRGEWSLAPELEEARVDEVLIAGCAPDPPEPER